MEKSSDAFRTISEVADDLALPQHVLRFWETRFPHIRPLKRAGGRRYYRPADVILLRAIRQLLYDDGYTIKGVQRLLKEQGARSFRAGTVVMAANLTEADLGGEAELEPGSGDLLAESSFATEMPLRASPAAEVPTDASHLLEKDRNALREALALVEECTRILEATRGLGRQNGPG